MVAKWTIGFCLACTFGAAAAQETLPEVEVRAETGEVVTIACSDPAQPSNDDVQRVLGLNDPALVPGMRKKLMEAAAEACNAGEPRIEVSRTATGRDLTWKASSAP